MRFCPEPLGRYNVGVSTFRTSRALVYIFFTGVPPFGAFIHKLILLLCVVSFYSPLVVVGVCVVNGLTGWFLSVGARRVLRSYNYH